MEDSPIAARLKILIEALGLSDSQFADKCSISRSTLSLFLSGKNKKLSDVMLSQIHDAFPHVSILWLLFGEGDKFKVEKNDAATNSDNDEKPFFEHGDTDNVKNSNLVSLNKLEEIVKNVINKSFSESFNSLEDLVLKTKEPLSPRKVSKITVY